MKDIIKLREEIDAIDTQLIQLIKKRIVVMKEIGEVKKQEKKPIRDYVREEEKLSKLTTQAKALSIPESILHHIWKVFFSSSEDIEK